MRRIASPSYGRTVGGVLCPNSGHADRYVVAVFDCIGSAAVDRKCSQFLAVANRNGHGANFKASSENLYQVICMVFAIGFAKHGSV